ncbi:MAG: YesL family protein [Spirochaetaceae bacterium]|jgi:uncharacterized membrane protein YesL|nr:YesL family protein [Spirochaetaceae bacterium]
MTTRGRPRRGKKRIFEGGLHLYLEKLFDGITLNILWLLCCIPVVTIGASTTAFYYTAVKVLRGERGRLFQEFWRSFKLNFFKATILWTIFGVLLFILVINRNIAPDINEGYFGLFLICLYTALAVLLLSVMLYAFPVLSRFDMPLAGIIKLSFYMSFRYIPYTLGLLGICAVSALVVYYIPVFILGVPCGALIVFSVLMEKILIRHTPRPIDGDEERYKWYLNLNPEAAEK